MCCVQTQITAVARAGDSITHSTAHKTTTKSACVCARRSGFAHMQSMWTPEAERDRLNFSLPLRLRVQR